MKAKFLYIAGSEIPSNSANSVHVMKFCEALSTLFDVTLMANKKTISTEEVFDTYDIKNKFKFSRYNKSSFLAFLYLIFATRFSIILTRSPLMLFLLMFNIKKDKIVFLELHHLAYTPLKLKFLKFIILFSRCKVITITHTLRLDVEKLLRAPVDIYVLPDGANVNPKPSEIKTKSTLGYVGSLGKGKGIEFVLRLANLLPEYHFLIYGGDDASIAHLKNISSKNITYMGFIKFANVYSAISDCDILLAPISHEVTDRLGRHSIGKWTSPLKIFEAWANMRPIITSDVPVLKEVCNHNNSISLELDANIWCDTIKNTEVELLQLIAKNGYSDLQRSYSWNCRAEKLRKIVTG